MTEEQIRKRAAVYTFGICMLIALPFMEGLVYGTCRILVGYFYAAFAALVGGLICALYWLVYEFVKDGNKENTRKEKMEW